MDLNPRSLIKNIPAKDEKWKAPVKAWVQDMYEKRKEKTYKKALKKYVKAEASEFSPHPSEPEKVFNKKEVETIPLSDIIIPESFLKTEPNEKKLKREKTFYKKHGRFEKNFVVNRKNMQLLETYPRYVIAKRLGLKEVTVRFQ